jgi:RNA polymerase sigma-70 factor (ECF subfamily)
MVQGDAVRSRAYGIQHKLDPKPFGIADPCIIDPRREHAIKTDLPLRDRRSGPVTQADRKDRLELLAQAIEKLSDDHREVILQMKIEGRSAREIGERMGRSENAVHLLLSRALKRLAEELKL